MNVIIWIPAQTLWMHVSPIGHFFTSLLLYMHPTHTPPHFLTTFTPHPHMYTCENHTHPSHTCLPDAHPHTIFLPICTIHTHPPTLTHTHTPTPPHTYTHPHTHTYTCYYNHPPIKLGVHIRILPSACCMYRCGLTGACK